jgi:hypothetical protein
MGMVLTRETSDVRDVCECIQSDKGGDPQADIINIKENTATCSSAYGYC